jgi:hypothetical protein
MEFIEILRISLTTVSYLVFTGILAMSIALPMIREEQADTAS